MKLGSLFDGAGTCPFAASIYSVVPTWASEIEPFPLKVTSKRFPYMKHLGDITKIDGAAIEPVDIITFGSPCQDLSVAGKRAGLDGERSGLFMDAVKIMKTMRRATNGRYPQVGIWENVPGAFSSNKGEDFRIVLEEICKIKDDKAVIPRPKDGKWPNAGLIVGDGYSVAWRVLDAQFWGVPQRRRRIYLVADFGGQCAGQILFERGGLSRNFAASRETWQGITRHSAYCAYGTRECCGENSGIEYYPEKARTLMARYDSSPCIDKGQNIVCFHILQDPVSSDKVAPCLSLGNPKSGQSSLGICAAFGETGQGYWQAGIQTLRAEGENRPSRPSNVVCYALDRAAFNQGANAQYNFEITDNGINSTLVAKGPGAVCCPSLRAYTLDSVSSNSMKSKNPNSGFHETKVINCLDTSDGNPCKNQGGNLILHTVPKYYVRRVIPKECARLQGMPDWWCDDIPHTDSAEYKMWGNGMALPCVMYVMENTVRILENRYGEK